MTDRWISDHPPTFMVFILVFFGGYSFISMIEEKAAAVSLILREGVRTVVSISPDKIDPANEGRLVHLTGWVSPPKKLVDPDYGVSADAVVLKRIVEMYQWDEICYEETVTTKGSKTTTRSYSHRPIWCPEPIDSEKFHQATDFRNPPISQFGPLSLTLKSSTLHIGAFQIAPEFLGGAVPEEPLALGEIPSAFSSISLANMPPKPFQGGAYFGRDPAAPEIGDRIIKYRVTRPQQVSLIARQVGASFAPFNIGSGSIQIVDLGTFSAEELFEKAYRKNLGNLWFTRFSCLGLMALSLYYLLGPLLESIDYYPVLGRVLTSGSFMSRLFGAIAMSAAVAGVVWISFAPASVGGIFCSTLLLGYAFLGKRRTA